MCTPLNKNNKFDLERFIRANEQILKVIDIITDGPDDSDSQMAEAMMIEALQEIKEQLKAYNDKSGT